MLRRVTGRDGHGIDLEMHCAETGMLVATASVPLGGLPRQHRMVARFEREVKLISLCGPNHLKWSILARYLVAVWRMHRKRLVPWVGSTL